MLIWVLVVGYIAMYKLCCDVFEYLRFMGRKGFTLIRFGFFTDRQIFSGIIAVLIAVFYFFTKNWIISNIIAISITLLMFKVYHHFSFFILDNRDKFTKNFNSTFESSIPL